jgi:acyl carrier protein
MDGSYMKERSLEYPKIAAAVNLVARALDLPPSSLDAQSSTENVTEWDSLGHLRICMAFQERFGVEMDIDTIASCTSVLALAKLVPSSHDPEP